MDEVENPEVSAPGQSVPPPDDVPPLTTDEPLGHPQLHSTIDSAVPSDFGAADALQLPPASDDTQTSTQSAAFKPPLPKDRVALPTRPLLKREGSAPNPIQIHPPIAVDVPDSPRESPDSLTLAELRKIRDGFPVTPGSKQSLPALNNVYDFEYSDPRNFALEIEEWFGYSEQEIVRLTDMPTAFEVLWAMECGAQGEDSEDAWRDSPMQERFVLHLLKSVQTQTGDELCAAFGCLCYLTLGVFRETAGQKDKFPFRKLFHNPMEAPYLRGYEYSGMQVRTMVECSIIMFRNGALEILLKVLKRFSDRDISNSLKLSADTPETTRTFDELSISDELWGCFTIIHTLFEIARLGGDTDDANLIRREISAHAPAFLLLFTEMIGALRWDEAAPVPISKLFMLHWKAVLLAFGSIEKVDEVKSNFKDKGEETDIRGHPIITASPLDYHLFRQEISSKYPAYQPPKPAFPFEPENNSILPPLRHRQSRYEVNNASAGGGTVSTGNGPIMHQPVHIATPAPSPPPSPAGPGGKGGKKQNYQTNQLFPFLYPPLDTSSNEIGGKGSTELQDALVGRRWEGSDIPASILEAAELFAKRMRATRAMKQLWKARVDFMKYERGWKDEINRDAVSDFMLDLDADITNGAANHSPTAKVGGQIFETQQDREEAEKEHVDPLDKVADFYDQALPVLQSFVIVSLKAVLKHVTDLVTTNGGRTGMPNSFSESVGESLPTENGVSHNTEGTASALEQVDATRQQEIANKALTGSLLLLLKWFKVSHILRYEYLTQLLLDSNYMPLVLKLWQSQDISRACHFKLDRPDYNFFTICGSGPLPRRHSTQSSASLSSLDSAAPPPISFHRRSSSTSQLRSPSPSPTTSTTHPPEIDELGYPTTPFPTSPLKSFSWRNIFSAQNHLRILQKLTRRKAHRSLLLVSYKSSNHLKKSLRVPVPELRYYTLKLFKSQVPYCGRKWRQSNMKIITAVWLSVPAELRDDWLVGGGGGMGGAGPGDLDGTVEEALPLEQSLRALTHWWNCAAHPDKMGRDAEGGSAAKSTYAERGFFERELEKMEGLFVGNGEQEEGGGEEAEWGGLVEGY
ncbi:hypothetical protein K461DRAFT_221388 [Myriangium duriaei CBS 260.36]|uniref:Factor arrest protein 11 n=1 Tax=Myriangium duriaei CBS 260.36 TaxID=1168546 RepID=A0A9P4J773_9PEZI|nr:hypothetical protein K461DRAFT_221388 [Myriangium duriaei CBS 260.36]